MPHGSHGFCGKHAYRWRKHGDPLGGGTAKGDAIGWLFQNVEHLGTDCLAWPFSKDPNGYGQVRYNGKGQGAHRVMCTLAHGEPPDAYQDASHSCGKGHLGCVNPRHLSWKTRAGNLQDRVDHGTIVRGEKSHGARLTEEDVRLIRGMKGQITQRELAEKFGVSPSQISLIHSGKKWAWLDAGVSGASVHV